MTVYVNDLNKNKADASSEYALNKGATLALANPYVPGDKKSAGKFFQGVLLFKGFVDSFSFERSMTEAKQNNIPTDIYAEERQIASIEKDIYKVDITVPSADINEALSNHYKMQFLYRMVGNESVPCRPAPDPKLAAQGDTKFTSEPNGGTETGREIVAVGVNIHLSNLISKHPKDTPIPSYTHENVVEYGQPGILEDCTYSPDMDVGFYEYRGRIFAKVFKLSLSFVVEAPGVNESFIPTSNKKWWKHQKGDERRPFGIPDYRDILNND